MVTPYRAAPAATTVTSDVASSGTQQGVINDKPLRNAEEAPVPSCCWVWGAGRSPAAGTSRPSGSSPPRQSRKTRHVRRAQPGSAGSAAGRGHRGIRVYSLAEGVFLDEGEPNSCFVRSDPSAYPRPFRQTIPSSVGWYAQEYASEHGRALFDGYAITPSSIPPGEH